MLKVALDFDGVLADTMSRWVIIYNKEHKKSITKSDITLYDIWKLPLQICEKDVYRILEMCWTGWKNLPPTEQNIADTVKEIRKMSSKVEVVTSVEGSFIDSVRLWLGNIGLGSIKVFYCPIESCEKASLDYDLFIDDNPETASAISKKGKKCLLYDQPWNRNVLNNNNIIRINHLSQALSYL
jgi:uncharacterized HAD superfamily protein